MMAKKLRPRSNPKAMRGAKEKKKSVKIKTHNHSPSNHICFPQILLWQEFWHVTKMTRRDILISLNIWGALKYGNKPADIDYFIRSQCIERDKELNKLSKGWEHKRNKKWRYNAHIEHKIVLSTSQCIACWYWIDTEINQNVKIANVFLYFKSQIVYLK